MPSALFMYKRLTEAGNNNFEITIFEKKNSLGAGMPYSHEGANDEHITNVSGNEIPDMVTSVSEWIKTIPDEILKHYNINPEKFNAYKVLPRLLFGAYLSAQFELLLQGAAEKGITTNVCLGCSVSDINYNNKLSEVVVELTDGNHHKFDTVIICTGHQWPKKYEGKIPGYYDSPYPPSKIAMQLNHSVAIRGTSLTAIDAIRTLARNNGIFDVSGEKTAFYPAAGSENFKMVLHSRSGLLPAVRFHLEDSHLKNNSLLTEVEIALHRKGNNGFLSLDFIFEMDFKRIFLEKDPDFYQKIKFMTIEEFVEAMMELREKLDPFVLLKAEYREAEQSIRRKESVYWKEMLATLSFAMNYPAKYLSAEDMLRLQKVLMPLISIVIAFIPQQSCKELIALHEAGLLDIVAVGTDSEIVPDENGGIRYKYTDENGNPQSEYYKTFIDCIGQPHLSYDDFPFKGLVKDKVISPAMLKFASAEEGEKASENNNVEKNENGDYYLKVPGITINDNFQVVDRYGEFNEQIFIMAVPYIGGYNPDYSELDFCEAASLKIIHAMKSA
ncbi:FAD/NAD(P)-binding protein [Flavobacterium sp. 3HN19-14]|uniref:FAD/NAD(P)-binding protein n=1 Tax=Flavobacterium sp. 3HN19-14 TaxID=3448133 RepID=UPI003EE32B1F